MTESGRVLVGVDGSDGSRGALDWAARYASLISAELRVVGVWHWPALYGPIPTLPLDALEAHVREEVEMLADSVRQRYRDLVVVPETLPGSPARVLVELSHMAGLLVVGSRGHGYVGGALAGSVSLHCVHHAHCPVLVVPSPCR